MEFFRAEGVGRKAAVLCLTFRESCNTTPGVKPKQADFPFLGASCRSTATLPTPRAILILS